MKKALLAAVAVGLLLSGCTGSVSPNVPPAIENFVGDEQAKERVLGYAEAIDASYQKLYETGMAETVTSAGDDYILSYAPGERFVAGLYNVEIQDVLLIEDEIFFTVASAYLALQDPVTVVTETDTGVSLSHPEYGDFSLVIENGLVVSGSDNAGTWSGTFAYEPDAKVTELVAKLLAEESSN